ncbi:PAS domain S-box protein [bacterium]|nr:PAS domain S-box protein [bacterium]
MTPSKKLLWKLFQSYLIITFLSLFMVALFTFRSLRDFYSEHTREILKIRAVLVRTMIDGDISFPNAGKIDAVCRTVGSEIGTRVTVITAGGVVVGDSEEDYRKMDNHGDRPEVKTALSGTVGMATRYSYTLKKDLMYVAVPVEQNGSIIGIVRTSMPVTAVSFSLKIIYMKIALTALVIIVIASIVTFYVSRWINRPIREMIQGINRFAGGDLDFRISMSGIYELETLSEGMNTMAAQLSERISTITEQRNEIEAVFSGMLEAVFAVDMEERIIEYNRAAEKLFSINPENCKGKQIQEVIRNTHLQNFVNTTLTVGETVEEEIVIHNGSDRVLHAHGTPLLDAQRGQTGAVIVLNDITQLKRLENVRRDFVANVSHELKTPITSIIGFVETLRDGAIEDIENRNQFLDIILKHSNRLNSIVEDLLSLSRIEQDIENGRIIFEPHNICEILNNVRLLCEPKARRKGITVSMSCSDTMINCNVLLLEQAVINLVDNAIKYSGNDSTVYIRSFQDAQTLTIEVSDSGCGIPQEHQTRIFERFYRVDKGRSRELGGTGLGLAIAKHSVLAHKGRIYVESTPGQGSTFTITLPVA